jgi:hypothetical protein
MLQLYVVPLSMLSQDVRQPGHRIQAPTLCVVSLAWRGTGEGVVGPTGTNVHDPTQIVYVPSTQVGPLPEACPG